MFDDSCNSHYQVAIPELLKRNMIATFYVNPGGNKWGNPKGEGPDQWENKIPLTGMVYGDHTWTHNGVKDLANADFEIGECQKKILSIFYKDNKPHLLSWGRPGVGPGKWNITKEELQTLLTKYNLIDRPPFDAKHGAYFGVKTTEEMLALADKAIAEKGMGYLIIHGVQRRAEEGDVKWGFQDFWALDKDIYRSVLDGLAARRDKGDLWITDHISEYKYQMERDNNPKFQVVKASPQQIQLKLTGTLDANLYDQPLTVTTQVPPNWQAAVVTQGTTSATVPAVKGVIQYDALPNGALITAVPGTLPVVKNPAPAPAR